MDASVLYPQIGIKEDTASSTGSAHAKLAQLLLDTAEILSQQNKGVVIASNTLKASADTERTSSSDTYAKIKEIQVFVKGVIRVTFDMKATDSGVPPVHGSIRVNGTEIHEFSTASSTYSTNTYDLSVDEFDLVQLYRKVGTGSAMTGYWKNFRIYYDYPTTEYVVKTD